MSRAFDLLCKIIEKDVSKDAKLIIQDIKDVGVKKKKFLDAMYDAEGLPVQLTDKQQKKLRKDLDALLKQELMLYRELGRV